MVIPPKTGDCFALHEPQTLKRTVTWLWLKLLKYKYYVCGFWALGGAVTNLLRDPYARCHIKSNRKLIFFLAAFWVDATREINKTRRKLSVSNPIHLNANSSTSMWCTWKSRGHTDHQVNLVNFCSNCESVCWTEEKASNTLNLNILDAHFVSKSIQVYFLFYFIFLHTNPSFLYYCKHFHIEIYQASVNVVDVLYIKRPHQNVFFSLRLVYFSIVFNRNTTYLQNASGVMKHWVFISG